MFAKQKQSVEKQNSSQSEKISSNDPNLNTILEKTNGSNDEIFTLLDARAEERFNGEFEPIDPKAGHIPGAVNRPFSKNLDKNGKFKSALKLRKEFENLLKDKYPTSVVHTCGSGISACHNLIAMESAGLIGSSLFVGSWSQWCYQSDDE